MAAPTLEEVMINDLYWFARARALVDNAILSREEAAAKLLSAVGWFWTVYSTVAIVGTAIADTSFSWWVAVALALPAVSLLFAYLLGLRVLMPHDGCFDRQSPTEIEEACNAILGLKKRRLKVAVGATIVAAATVVGAVLAAAVTSPATDQTLSARFRPAGDEGRLVVAARVQAETDVVVSVRPEGTTPEARPVEVIERSSKRGDVRSDVAVPLAGSYEVELEWVDDDLTRSVSKNVPGA
ncbi:MAG TPA: hypothetical protein VHG90_12450 [Acidimicrobiales bacterium]|nr:hypothetical protein [Acidimicrobiales bacterium]